MEELPSRDHVVTRNRSVRGSRHRVFRGCGFLFHGAVVVDVNDAPGAGDDLEHEEIRMARLPVCGWQGRPNLERPTSNAEGKRDFRWQKLGIRWFAENF